MKTLNILLSQSWNMLFRDKRSFLVIFLFQFFPGFIILFTVFCFYTFADLAVKFFWLQISHLLNFFATTPSGIILFVIICIIVVIGFIMVQILCYYLSQKWLVHIFRKKKISVKLLLSESKGVWSWMGTGLSISLYFIGLFTVCLILAILSTFVHDALVLSSVALFVLGFIFLWVSTYLSIPSYFLDDVQYFKTVTQSFSLVRGRWWKTFGYIAVVLIIALLVSLFFVLSEKVAGYGLKHAPASLTEIPALNILMSLLYIAYAFVQLIANVFVQLFLSSYSYQLYTLYKKSQ